MIADQPENVTLVLENLEIPDALFTSDEYSKGKKLLIEGKVLETDEFGRKFLKY